MSPCTNKYVKDVLCFKTWDEVIMSYAECIFKFAKYCQIAFQFIPINELELPVFYGMIFASCL